MIEVFEKYIKEIVNQTFGFEPSVRVTEIAPQTIQIFVEGTPLQRSMIMGKNALNFKAISRLLTIFSRRNNCFTYFYVKPKDTLDKQLEETITSNLFES